MSSQQWLAQICGLAPLLIEEYAQNNFLDVTALENTLQIEDQAHGQLSR